MNSHHVTLNEDALNLDAKAGVFFPELGKEIEQSLRAVGDVRAVLDEARI